MLATTLREVNRVGKGYLIGPVKTGAPLKEKTYLLSVHLLLLASLLISDSENTEDETTEPQMETKEGAGRHQDKAGRRAPAGEFHRPLGLHLVLLKELLWSQPKQQQKAAVTHCPTLRQGTCLRSGCFCCCCFRPLAPLGVGSPEKK